ncbi:MAG: hypothetical protein JJ934_03325 [Pseudomonadales bacterium]|nr:hypothetical protein [Pseudomonadales bacterium]
MVERTYEPVELTEKEHHDLVHKKAKEEEQLDFERTRAGQETATIGSQAVSTLRKNQESNGNAATGNKRKKQDLALHLSMMEQLRSLQDQIDWYEQEIMRLRREAEEHQASADLIEQDLKKLDELSPSNPAYQAILDKHGVNNAQELKEKRERELNFTESKTDQANDFEKEKAKVEGEADKLRELHNISEYAAAQHKHTATVALTGEANASWELLKGTASNRISDEQRQVAHAMYTEQHENQGEEFDVSVFSNLGSVASQIDGDNEQSTYKATFNTAASAHQPPMTEADPGPSVTTDKLQLS